MTIYVVSPTWGGVGHEATVFAEQLAAEQYAWDLCHNGDASEEDDQVNVTRAVVQVPRTGPRIEDPNLPVHVWSAHGSYFVIVENLEEGDVGRRVVYTPSGRRRGQAEEALEYGHITSFNETTVFVHYDDQHEEADGKGTNPWDLNFVRPGETEGPAETAPAPPRADSALRHLIGEARVTMSLMETAGVLGLYGTRLINAVASAEKALGTESTPQPEGEG